MEPQSAHNNLDLNGNSLLVDVPENVATVADPGDVGVLVAVRAEKAAARHVFPLGTLTGIKRFTACHRSEPFWMIPATGTRGGEVPIETQYLLAERENGDCALFVPLIDGAFRASLQGNGENGLELVVESGDPGVVGTEFVGLFVAAGPDPYALMEPAARSVMARLKTGRLRHDKALPDFVDKLGWCTWDSFYEEVSHDKLRYGFETFKAGGVVPKAIILDVGWQSVKRFPTGEDRLTAFAANEKFPGDLGPTVKMAKEEFGVETFLVWHTMFGYWGGIDPESLPGYGVRTHARSFSPGILHYLPTFDGAWGPVVGLVPPENAYRFFQDYHRHLRLQGVDGVKTDSQASLEGMAAGFGGRVAAMRAYHEALEGSAHAQFQGKLINCMSCSNDMLYSALNSVVTRTSTDFWPDRPESHGMHLYTNAQVSLWFGEFVLPDWDMFQSGHAMGAYHAAGRAVGGCPVYVCDKPEAHDFEVLRKLTLPDGRVLRAMDPGRPTRDCLFHDPTKEPVLLKIFNRNNRAGGGIVGAFNARYGTEEKPLPPIAGVIRPSDVASMEPNSAVSNPAGERFAVYAHNSGELRVLARDEAWEIVLPSLAFELFTIAPIEGGFAAIGLPDKYNSAGAFTECCPGENGTVVRKVLGGGRFLAYSDFAPKRVEANGNGIPFTYDPTTGRLEANLPSAPSVEVRIWPV